MCAFWNNSSEIAAQLYSLKAKRFQIESLMSSPLPGNAENVSTLLRELISEFDNFVDLCEHFDENDTLPGSTSHKVEVFEGNQDVIKRVNKWLHEVEVTDVCGSPPIPKPRRVYAESVISRPSEMSCSSRSSRLKECTQKVKLA